MSAVLIKSCSAHSKIHPGAPTATNSAYDALLIAETTIDQARLELQTGHLPAKAKEALDALIRDDQPVTEQRLSQLALRPNVILVK